MAKYLRYLVTYTAFWLLGMILAPLLPLFASMRSGPSDNGNATAVEPRLPNWLYWFDTTFDNGLWGDHGWRTEHAPNSWGAWCGMVGWLWRNCACGFSRSVIAHPVDLAETFELTSSGCGLDLDKSNGKQGWFLIRSDAGAFQIRWVKAFGRLRLSLEAGWLLDVYMKDSQAVHCHPKAIFMFEPKMARV